jgi:predicted RNA-binding protein YlqC (UPF0109 family)
MSMFEEPDFSRGQSEGAADDDAFEEDVDDDSEDDDDDSEDDDEAEDDDAAQLDDEDLDDGNETDEAAGDDDDDEDDDEDEDDAEVAVGAQVDDDEDEDDDEDDDDDDDDDEEEGAVNRLRGAAAKAVLEHITRTLVDDPESVVVDVSEGRTGLRFSVHVAQGDMGRLIGRKGRTAQAIRTLVRAAAASDGTEASVDIVD